MAIGSNVLFEFLRIEPILITSTRNTLFLCGFWAFPPAGGVDSAGDKPVGEILA